MKSIGWALLSLLAFACQAAKAPPPDYTLDAEAIAMIESEKQIFVAPPEFFSPRFREHEEALQTIDRLIKAHLRERGFRILPTTEFRNAWQACEAEVGGLYDTRSGSLDNDRVSRCMGMTLKTLASAEQFSGVVVPQVIYKSIEMKRPYDSGTWDGVRRDMLFEGGQSGSRWVTVSGMSLSTRVLTKYGKRAYDGMGGLDFAQKALKERSTLNLVAKETDDFDEQDLREGVEIALRGFVDKPDPDTPR